VCVCVCRVPQRGLEVAVDTMTHYYFQSLHAPTRMPASRSLSPPLPPPALGAGGRLEAVSSSARWEDVVGYSRAVKRGPFIFVSGGWAALAGRQPTVTP
jgi:hypothetical protein